MEVSKVREVLQKYADECQRSGHAPCRIESNDPRATGPGPVMRRHIHWMCTEALTWPDERKEKMMRWLGFVQGVLCAHGWKTIADVKRDSMPDGAAYE